MKKGEQVVLTAPLAAVLRVEHMSTHCGRCFIPLSTSHDGGSGKTPEVCEGCSFFTVCHECAQAEVNCDGQGGACEGVFAVHRECGECFVLQVFLQPLSLRMHEACAHRLPEIAGGRHARHDDTHAAEAGACQAPREAPDARPAGRDGNKHGDAQGPVRASRPGPSRAAQVSGRRRRARAEGTFWEGQAHECWSGP